jgi:hypothetical protein
MYCIAASPLAKVFQPHLHQSLLENPENIFKTDSSIIYVPRSCGRVALTLGVPKLIAGRQTSDKDEDILYLMHWLTGGPDGLQVQETECYGIVQLDLQDEVMARVTQMVHEAMINPEAAKKASLDDATRAEMARAKQNAVALSELRVMRAIRRCWEQLQKQYDINQESGLGKYRPSPTEVLCQYVLRKEINAEKARQARIDAAMADTLGEARLTETIPETRAPEPDFIDFAPIVPSPEPAKRGPGRPAGAKNKPKQAEES